MTKDDIIQAAFIVWGRDCYKTTSLSRVAEYLGVTKPALYRHFRNKEALFDEMYENFFGRAADWLKPYTAAALKTPDETESLLVFIRYMVISFIQSPEVFLFFSMNVYGNENPERDLEVQLKKHGVDLDQMQFNAGRIFPYPSSFHCATMTALFLTGLFLKPYFWTGTCPGDAKIDSFLEYVEEKISSGLLLHKDEADTIDFRRLEDMAGTHTGQEAESDGLLKGVAEAIAEAGPWNASMDMIAQHSGLSKGGLYAHFKSKEDMIVQLFTVELDRLDNAVREAIQISPSPREQLYLSVMAIANYLRARPEILIALDWIRVQRAELDIDNPPRVFSALSELILKPILGEGGGSAGGGTGRNVLPEAPADVAAGCILFLIINLLTRKPRSMAYSDIPDSSFRILYKFIVSGLKGVSI